VSEKYPKKKFHGSNIIEVDLADEKKIAFLEFNIDCINGPVTNIEFSLRVKDASDQGGRISTTNIPSDIEELDWNNAPSRITGAVSIGSIKAKQTKTLTLPIYLLGNNPNKKKFALRIDPESTDGADYYKSGIHLKVSYQGTPIPSCVLPDPNWELMKTVLAPSGSIYVNEKHPNKNFKDTNAIEVDRSPHHKVVFVKFNVECIKGDIHKVSLMLPVTNGSDQGGRISKTDSNWYDHNLNWNNAPTVGDESVRLPSVSIGVVNSKNTKVVTLPNSFLDGYQGKELSLRIDPESDDGAGYYKNGILLEVTYMGALALECSLYPKILKSSPASGDYFQTKLYWEAGYRWQESSKEKRFCAACSDDCKDNLVKLKVCDYKNQGQFWRWKNGQLESKKATGYCASVDGTVKPNARLIMMSCNSATKFMGFHTPPNPNKFTWHPLGNNRLCVTNQHHPRSNEDLRFNDCKRAHKDKTGFWVTGTTWDKSLGGY